MPVIAYVNGEYVHPESAQLPIDERGHQYGDGVYEVFRVYGGRIFLLDWHLERLYRSMQVIGIDNPHTHDEWVDIITDAVRASNEAEAQIYLQVTRGVAVRNHLFPNVRPSVSMTVRPTERRTTGDVNALICLPDERWANPYVKSLNLLPNILAKETAHRVNAKEALLIRNGLITEGSSSNAWFVYQGKLRTAPANRYILNGITRRFVLQLANEIGVEVIEESVRLEELPYVDEVFMTGTTIEILPIHRISYAPELRDAYFQLPDEAAVSLVHDGDAVAWEPYWATALPVGADSLTNALQGAFRRHIEKFQRYELT